jgi:hypothetical protein
MDFRYPGRSELGDFPTVEPLHLRLSVYAACFFGRNISDGVWNLLPFGSGLPELGAVFGLVGVWSLWSDPVSQVANLETEPLIRAALWLVEAEKSTYFMLGSTLAANVIAISVLPLQHNPYRATFLLVLTAHLWFQAAGLFLLLTLNPVGSAHFLLGSAMNLIFIVMLLVIRHTARTLVEASNSTEELVFDSPQNSLQSVYKVLQEAIKN